MAKKPVSLTVHRNKVEAHRKRERATTLKRQVEAMVRERDIRAYAVVGIGADGQAYVLWDTGAIMPMRAFPAVVADVLNADIAMCEVEEDWRPALAR